MHYLFDDYTLDTARRELLHVGGVVPLEPKVYQVLVYLMEHRDRLVDKEELLDHIWPEIYIHDNAVARCVAALRQALGDSPQRQQIIQTRRGQGYRFVASVVAAPPGHDTAQTGSEPAALALAAVLLASVGRENLDSWGNGATLSAKRTVQAMTQRRCRCLPTFW